MVARKEGAERRAPQRVDDAIARLFLSWRALLSRAARVATAPSAPIERRHRIDPHAIVPYAAGWACLIAGAMGSLLLAGVDGRRAAWFALASTVVWAFGRLLVLDLVLHTAVSAGRAGRSWAWGLVPYVIALHPGLTLIAWAASAGLTWWLLRRLGVANALAFRGVATAWAVQATFALLTWTAVNAWVAFLAR